eukprot:scaffold327021_cov31-Prasinocladus_malaysianus.AAC.1
MRACGSCLPEWNSPRRMSTPLASSSVSRVTIRGLPGQCTLPPDPAAENSRSWCRNALNRRLCDTIILPKLATSAVPLRSS